MQTSEYESELLGALSRSRSDLELVLGQDGSRKIKVHSQKLALSSPVMCELMDLMEEDIISARRSSREQPMELPKLTVRVFHNYSSEDV